MRIGIPKEVAFEEKRVALVPAGVDSLVRAGHTVYIETGAGEGSNFSDDEYRAVGANIVYQQDEVYLRSEVIAKVAPLSEAESEILQDNQVVFSFLHLAGSKKDTVENLLKKNVTAIGYELIEENNRLPVLHMMSEIAGQLSIQMAEKYLESGPKGGRGVLLGGLAGVAPAAVVIIGAGVVGINAARAALGRGAQVIMLDKNLERLREVENLFEKNVTTVVANPYTISRGAKFADVLIGAIMVKGEKVTPIVTEEMVKTMKKGSVIVDVAIDQGGCFETSRMTTISAPVYEMHNVIHYCIPNMPAMVSRTSSYALTNASLQYIQNIADNGLTQALLNDHSLSKGVCTYKGFCSNEVVASSLNLEFKRLHVFSTN